ncbi:MAG: helix-turn-helix domain-containing protein [Dokdonella sp.]|uniref:helix-turn-helix domain-containing protein n=1 Tax=Dokdonella sp. TaxID=2291710 RepID=UPI0032640E6E
MKTSPVSTTFGALEGLGITRQEETLYRALLRGNGYTVAQLAEITQLARHAQRGLTSLEKKGFVTHSPEHVRRYFAVPPDLAIDVLIARRQHEVDNQLRRARAAIVELQETVEPVDDDQGTDERVVEILSREAAGQVHAQMLRSAKDEVLCLERTPIIVSPVGRPDDSQLESMERGVRYLTVSDDSILGMPGSIERLRNSTVAGERYRVVPSLPFKMIIVDRRIAILPLTVTKPDGNVLLVRSSALLDALVVVFDMFWERATPITFSGTGESRIGDPARGLTREVDEVLPLLAAGLNDKTIAHQLDYSLRTLERRVVEIMESLGARTRFQAGWLAALRLKSSIARRTENGRRVKDATGRGAREKSEKKTAKTRSPLSSAGRKIAPRPRPRPPTTGERST